MKTISTELKVLLQSSQQFIMADLFTITLNNGNVIYYTNADVNIVWNGNAFAFAPITRGTTRCVIGSEVDTLEMSFFLGLNDLIFGMPFPQFVQNGGFDGARIQLEKAFLSDSTTVIGTIVMFVGRVSDVTPSRTEVKVAIKSDLELLNVQMPRNLYQPACQHALYDGGCGLSKTSFAVNSAVNAGSTSLKLMNGLSQADGYFDMGTVTFTSGVNIGVTRTVKTYTAGVLNLSVPLPSLPSTGDTFKVYAGCDKTLNTCINKFNNKVHFKGFPFVPIPETAL